MGLELFIPANYAYRAADAAKKEGQNMAKCPCDSGTSYEECCKPFHSGDAKAPTAEALMRSRYSAFAKSEIDYIVNTIHPKNRASADEEGARNWSETSFWRGLEVLEVKGGGEEDTEGSVEFIAAYTQEGHEEDHHELATFEKVDGTWYFVDGNMVGREPFVRPEPKVGRNDPCPCGSGKKFKKCCGK